MKMYTKYIFVGLLGILVIGCRKDVIEQKPGAQYVVLTTTEPDPRVCVYLGDAEAQARNGDLGKAQLEARDKMKNKAIELKGNTVMMDTTLWESPGFIVSGEVVLSGRVFRCDFPREQMDPTRDAVGASSAADERRKRSGDATQQDLFNSVQSQGATAGNNAPATNIPSTVFNSPAGNNQNNQPVTNNPNNQGTNFPNNQGVNSNNNPGNNQNNQGTNLFDDTRIR